MMRTAMINSRCKGIRAYLFVVENVDLEARRVKDLSLLRETRNNNKLFLFFSFFFQARKQYVSLYLYFLVPLCTDTTSGRVVTSFLFRVT